MGKHIKTAMDERFINELATEVYKLDPENEKLKELSSLPNYEGGELKFENGELYKLKENSVIFFASGILFGSEEYTPSTSV